MESLLPPPEGLKLRVARGFFPRLRGLIGSKPLPPGEGLLFENCRAIHTCFMSYPIDAIFLDRSGRVVKRVNSIPPWRFISGGPDAYSVIETAATPNAPA